MSSSPTKRPSLPAFAVKLVHAARDAGWARVAMTMDSEGTLTLDASMVEPEQEDDLLSCELRMGK